ncbi:MAG: ABC transporter ATP-binding protein [Marinilabiliaceae bacterium]
MLRVENLHFSYGNGASVLNGVSFSVSKGSICGLFGPNGSGKTTLFKCCLKFLKYPEGRIVINGRDVQKLAVKDMAKMVSYVPQDHKPPFPYLVKDVVLMGRTPHLQGVFGISRDHKRKVIEALNVIGMMDMADKPYNQLSGGQRQLVLIARSVAQETPLIFLDEPTSALDFSNQIKVWNILRRIAEKGTTIIACTHDPNHVLWFCDDVVVMGSHSLVAHGPPQKIISDGILDLIYTDVCQVRDLDQTKIVLPSGVVESKAMMPSAKTVR